MCNKIWPTPSTQACTVGTLSFISSILHEHLFQTVPCTYPNHWHNTPFYHGILYIVPVCTFLLFSKTHNFLRLYVKPCVIGTNNMSQKLFIRWIKFPDIRPSVLNFSPPFRLNSHISTPVRKQSSSYQHIYVCVCVCVSFYHFASRPFVDSYKYSKITATTILLGGFLKYVFCLSTIYNAICLVFKLFFRGSTGLLKYLNDIKFHLYSYFITNE
jgi:hypothetical protein